MAVTVDEHMRAAASDADSVGITRVGSRVWLKGNSFRQFRPVGKDEVAAGVDVTGPFRRHRYHGIGAWPIGSAPADTTVEVGPLLNVHRPRGGMHGEPLRGEIVGKEKACAHRGEYRQKTRPLHPAESAPNVIETALDNGATAVIGEVAQTTQRGQDPTPHRN